MLFTRCLVIVCLFIGAIGGQTVNSASPQRKIISGLQNNKGKNIHNKLKKPQPVQNPSVRSKTPPQKTFSRVSAKSTPISPTPKPNVKAKATPPLAPKAPSLYKGIKKEQVAVRPAPHRSARPTQVVPSIPKATPSKLRPSSVKKPLVSPHVAVSSAKVSTGVRRDRISAKNVNNTKIKQQTTTNKAVVSRAGISRIPLVRPAVKSSRSVSSNPLTTAKPQKESRQAPVQVQQSCGVCFEDKATHDFSTLSCGHTFCKICLNTLVENAIKEKRMVNLQCPNPECRKLLNEQDIRKITNNNQRTFNAYADIKMREWLATQPNAKQCPTRDCSVIFLNEMQRPYTVTCQGCKKSYCAHCLSSHQRTISCQQAEEQRRKLTAQNSAAARASEAWIHDNAKKCPNCQIRCYKTEGCDYVKCRCSYQFCWLCLAPHDHNMIGHAETEHHKKALALQAVKATLAVQQVIPAEVRIQRRQARIAAYEQRAAREVH